MHGRGAWWKTTLLVATFQWVACVRYATATCELHNAHACPTFRQEDSERYDKAYVKLCEGAIDAPSPLVSGAETEWDQIKVNINCGDEEGVMEKQEYLSNTTFLRAHNNVVELETRDDVTRDYCIDVLLGKSPGAHQQPSRKDPREKGKDLSTEFGRGGVATAGNETQELPSLGTQHTEPHPQYIAHFCKIDPLVQRYRDRQVCSRITCLRKCCPPGKFLRSGEESPMCIYSDNYTKSWTLDGSTHIRDPDSFSHFHIIYSIPTNEQCFNFDNFTIVANGYLEMEGDQFSQEDYCVDYQEQDSGEIKEVVHLCLNLDECGWKYRILNPVLMGVSCVFLAATAVVYIFVAELRRDNSSRCIVAMALTTIVTYIIVIVHTFTREYMEHHPSICSVTAFLNLSSILSTFFWINVFSYDIWKTITSGQSGSGRSWKVFFRYEVYAWGCPSLLAALAVLTDTFLTDTFLNDTFLNDTYLRPGFNDPYSNCWFSTNESRWIYKDSIILVLMVVNCGFFLHVVYSLNKMLNNRQLRNETSQRTCPIPN
ncbi:probable G-protein coupled receptor Mth-like 3 [Procambarus clarkii]|uniref:probable G-protein coupled receptor Mth-like 3 n=1 Tax=Procambarus clarkii TaxID=6728 RepID=UPI0037430BD1